MSSGDNGTTDETGTNTEAKKTWKTFPKRRPFSFGALVLIAVMAVVEFFDPYPGMVWARYIFTPPWTTEVTVELEVDGEPVTLTRKLPRINYPRWVAFQWSPGSVWPIKSFGTRLKNGGAVIVVSPGMYSHKKFPETGVSPKYRPVVAYAPDADDMGRLEVYYAPSYFDHPDARVRFKGMKARRLSIWEGGDDPDEFAFFGGGYNTQKNHANYIAFKKNTAPGIAYWRQEAGEEIWGEIPEVAEYFNSLTEPTMTPNEAVRVGLSQKWGYQVFGRSVGGINIRAFEQDGSRRRVDQSKKWFGTDTAVPLSNVDEMLAEAGQPMGHLIFERGPRRDVGVKVGGKDFVWQLSKSKGMGRNTPLIFDSKSKKLFFFGHRRLRMPKGN